MKDTLSHRQLGSLMQVSNFLNSSLDHDSIIQSMMKETISVIDAADAGILFLYNSKLDCLEAKSTFGYNTSRLMQVKLKPGQAMAGRAFSAMKCLIFADQNEVRDAYTSLSVQTLDLFNQSVPTYPFSAICIPIISNGECLGVINLGSFQPHMKFSEDDVNLLTAISHQAAVALEKARLYHEKEKAVQELELLNITITQQNKMFARSIELHNTLAALVLDGEGLSSILDYIPKKMGYLCLLFDDIGELVSSASSLDLAEITLKELKRASYSFVDTSDTTNNVLNAIIDGEVHKVVLLPVGSKPRLLGVLAVLSTREIEKVDITALEHACTIISLELMKKKAVSDTERRLKGEFIDVLFSGKIDESLIQKAKHLQLDAKSNYIAIIINVKDIEGERHKRQLFELVKNIFSKTSTKAVIVRKDDQIVILLSFFRTQGSLYNQQCMVKESLNDFQYKLNVLNWADNVSIGIGRIKTGLQNAHKSAQEAAKCIQFIQVHDLRTRRVSYSDLGVQRLLLQSSEEELLEFIYDTLGPLLEYDRTREGTLLPTLFTYLEHNCKGTETAKILHMHVNTLAYRLRRIEEILSLELTDTKKFMDVQMAVIMYQYLKERLS